MNRDQDVDRSEDATPFKLQEARKRGAAARSTDAASFAVLAALVGVLMALGDVALKDLSRLLARGMSLPPAALTTHDSAARALGELLVAAMGAISPLLFAVVVASLLVGVLQTGGLFSTTPLVPDPKRLDPVAGLKRLFSFRLLYEAVKSTLKLAALALTAYLVVKALLPGVPALAGLPAKAMPFELVDASGRLAAALLAVLAVFTLVDLVFARWDFLRNLRMSRKELEDELKHREGDPRIKARLRELRAQFLQRTRSLAQVPKADLLVTNPTHVAVALRYERGRSPAPQVLAKGSGQLAARMRDVAFRARVPIVHSPALARALFREVSIDGYVPERWYPQVARLLVWLHAARRLGISRPGARA